MATVPSLLQNLNVSWQVQDDPIVIADLVKYSGMLQTGIVQPSNHGNKHKYKIYNTLPSAAFRNPGSGIVPVTISTDLRENQLWECSLLVQEDQKIVDSWKGGQAGFIRDNTPALLASLGQKAATQIAYGTSTFGSQAGFVGLHQYIKEYGNVVSQKGGTTGSRCSLIAVRWNADDGVSLRVLPNAAGNLINNEYLGKSLLQKSTTTNEQLPVYSWYVWAYFTLVVPAKTAAAAITQIDATHAPTSPNIDDLVDAVRGVGDVYIYGNKDALSYVTALKYAKGIITLTPVDTRINNLVTEWNGVSVIREDNLVTTETTALD